MPKVIDKIRFFEFGKQAPSNSRFKGIMNTNTLFGANGYLSYTERNDANEDEIKDQLNYNNGFLGYTSRSEATSSTLTNMGYLNDSNRSIFVDAAREAFSKDGDIAWECIISFESYELMNSAGIFNQKDYGEVIQKVLPSFFKKVGIDPNNTIWWENYHINKAHPHMHVVFMEKDKTRTRGKFTDKELKELKREIIKETLSRPSLENLTGKNYVSFFKEKDEYKRQMIDKANTINLDNINNINELYKILPRSGRLQYGSKIMAKYRPAINKIIDNILQDENIRYDYMKFLDAIDQLDTIVNDVAGEEIGNLKNTEMSKLYKQIGNILLKDYKQKYKLLKEENDKIITDNIFNQINEDMDIKLSEDTYDSSMTDDDDKNDDSIKEYYLSVEYKKLIRDIHDENKDHDYKQIKSKLLNECINKNPMAMEEMAKLIKAGLIKDEGSASYWYEQALKCYERLDKKYPNDFYKYKIGKYYMYGLGCEKNEETAEKWFKESINNKNSLLALGYLKQFGANPDIDLAFECYFNAGERGNGMGYYRAARMISDHIIDKSVAMEHGLYKNALNSFLCSKNKSENILMIMGEMYQKGLGCDVSVERSLDMYLKAYELHNNGDGAYKAAELLSNLCPNDNRIETLYSEALKCYLSKIEAEPDDRAEYKVAKMFYKGVGTVKNVELAIKFGKEAASKGNVYASVLLAKIYMQDNKIDLALNQLNDCMSKNDPTVFFMAGICHIKNNNKEYGFQLIQKAAEIGYDPAEKFLDKSNRYTSNKSHRSGSSSSLFGKIGGYLKGRIHEIEDEINKYLCGNKNKSDEKEIY